MSFLEVSFRLWFHFPPLKEVDSQSREEISHGYLEMEAVAERQTSQPTVEDETDRGCHREPLPSAIFRPSSPLIAQLEKMVAQRLLWLTAAVVAACGVSTVDAFCRHSPRSKKCEPATRLFNGGPIKHRVNFNTPPLRDGKDPPRLILISGCPGTGKSTFGMSLALEQGILKCISTDTVRAVMRSYVPSSISPPLHR